MTDHVYRNGKPDRPHKFVADVNPTHYHVLSAVGDDERPQRSLEETVERMKDFYSKRDKKKV